MARVENWEKAYSYLIDYYKKYGNIYVSRDYVVDGFKLGRWLDSQRRAYRDNTLSEERKNKLIKLDANLGIIRTKKSFDFYCELLKAYYEEFGNIDVPQNYVINGVKLGMWLSRIRHLYKVKDRQHLTQEEVNKLNDLGVKWEACNSNTFDFYYSLLQEYHKKYGNINVPNRYKIQGVRLGRWLDRQRQAYQDYLKNTHTVSMVIDKSEIDKLNELGMIWCLYCKDWTANYNLLYEYYKKYGNIDIPLDYELNGVYLGYWLSVQRQLYSESKLSKLRILKLNKYNIDWNEEDTKILNNTISDMELYNFVLNKRVNNILDDLIIEKNNRFASLKKQRTLENELINRIWR